MKNLKKVLALVLAVVMIMGTVAVASAKSFTDVKGTDNYANAIDALSALGILDGFEGGTFQPESTLTRAQAAKIVAIVNNAKTNGAIKGQDAISSLYSNAQNPFVDCNGSWALPFINYCRITGLADGMTATTYEPNRQLTGVQWLKLMLTTLSFDTAKEGYTGTGWDVNVLNRANEIGLTAGLADDWKAIAPITRGEAAQILFNALTSNLVEYGQMVKNYKDPTDKTYPWNASFVSNEQVNATAKTLFEKMGGSVTRSFDVFMRPGYVWAYGSWSAFYMDTPSASYTTKTTICDILVDGMKLAKTSNHTRNAYYFRNGTIEKLNGMATVSHVTANATSGWTCAEDIGGNGALTQVFPFTYIDGTTRKTVYIITTVDTLLAKVTGVTASKHNNTGTTVSSVTTAMDVYVASLNGGSKFTNHTEALTVAGLSDYAKNDYALFYVAQNEWAKTGVNIGTNDAVNKYPVYTGTAVAYDNTNRDVYAATATQRQGYYVVPIQKADTIENATFSGQDYTRETVTVNGTRTLVNCTYTMTGIFYNTNYVPTPIKGSTLATNFYVDQYGNVIGDSNVFASNYAIIDSIMWVNDGGLDADKYAQAKLIGVDAEATLAKVASYYGKSVVAAKSAVNGDPSKDPVEVAQDATNNLWFNDSGNNLGVVKYTVDANGNYALTSLGANCYAAGSNFNIKAGQVKFDVNGSTTFYASNDTKFVVRTVSGGKYVYTAYAGVNALPTMSNVTAAVVVYNTTGDNYAAFVFLVADNAIFAGSDTVAYVTKTEYVYAEYGVSYYYDVYVNGEKTTIEAQITKVNNADNLFANGTGLYTLHFGTDDKKVTSATKLTTADSWIDGVVNKGIDDKTAAISVTVSASGEIGLNVTSAKVYVVEDGAVTVGTVADLTATSNVIYKLVGGSTFNVDTIFVVR